MANVKLPALRIRTFGRFVALRGGVPIPETAWKRRMAKAVLKVLLTAPDEVFTKDQLIELLLPGADPGAAAKNLQARISELRRALEPDLLRGRDSAFVWRIGEAYLFSLSGPCRVDCVEFENGLRAVRPAIEGGQWADATDRLEDVLALYRGDFLSEDRYEAWAEPRRSQLRGLFLEGLQSLAEGYAQLGRLRQAMSCCQRLISLEPYREEAIRQLMEYQLATGQRSAALETFREGERALREVLDVAPSAETCALHTKICSPSTSGDALDPRRVAVLPLACFSTDPEDAHLAEGLTEAMISSLSRIGDLRVVARTSVMRYQNTVKPVAQIARELNVGTILEGSVRVVHNRVRVTIQMIDGRTEDHLWARDYEQTLDDPLAAERDVALQVADTLRLQLLPVEERRLSHLGSQSHQAYVLYLKGRHLFNRRRYAVLRKAMSFFQAAIELDPGYALPHVGLADCLAHLAGIDLANEEAYEQAKASLERALSLQPGLPDAHASMALIEWGVRGLRDEAEVHCRRAIRLSPSHAQVHDWYALILLAEFRLDEALSEARRALDLDPLSPVYHCAVARALISANRFREAETLLAAASDVDPSYAQVDKWLALSKQLTRRWEDADAAVERFLASTSRPAARQFLAQQQLYTGRVEESLSTTRAIVAESPGVVDAEVSLGAVLYHAGLYDELESWMNAALKRHPWGVTVAGQAPMRWLLGLAYERQSRFGEASREFRCARSQFPPWADSLFIQGHMHVQVDAALAVVDVRAGRAGNASECLRALDRRRDLPDAATSLAVLLFHLGRWDEGFDWLGKAVDRHDRALLTIGTHPWFEEVRGDPRFADVLARLRLLPRSRGCGGASPASADADPA